MKKLVMKSRLLHPESFAQQMVRTGTDFSEVIWQHDRIYLPRDFRPNMNYPRLILRTEVRKTEQPAIYTLILKRHIEDSGLDYSYSTKITNYGDATAMVQQLGFKEEAEVSRRRQESWLDEHTVMYLDEVDELDGKFLKLEVELLENEAIEVIRKDLLMILSMLGQKTFLMQPYHELLKVTAEEFMVE